MAKKSSKKTVETLKHDADKRKNIPTAEFQSVVKAEQQSPIRVAYERRNRDLDPQLVWRGKDEQDWSDLVVHAPPLYIQEKVHPKVLIDDLLRRTADRRSQEPGYQTDLFAEFNGLPASVDKTDFYQHEQNWSNRMILGDSLQVMASLAEREGLRGKVQCIYLDPPYGIKFNSNFQWSTTSRDVKDGKADHITREPEQVKAFRDTWRDGIHSYLTYLRDRLTVARDLLADSGSIFVQIGDENVHRVRAVMDEVFGDTNHIIEIKFRTTSNRTADFLPSIFDTIVAYAKDKAQCKFRRPYKTKDFADVSEDSYGCIETNTFEWRRLTKEEKETPKETEKHGVLFGLGDLTSSHEYIRDVFEWQGGFFGPKKRYWSTSLDGLRRLGRANRLCDVSETLRYKRIFNDTPASPLTNVWADTGSGSQTEERLYVVQTVSKAVERCLLMSTDPGDLVLDPTCGSGTTACVAEQWGRRWITIDTSRVALALARARIMGARYPYYLLADSRDGQIKEAEVTRTAPSSQPVHGNIRHGFVYERVPHITLKSIANNAEIDVIWKRWQLEIAPLLQQISAMVSEERPEANHRSQTTTHILNEWEIPRERPSHWPLATQPLITSFWQARIARQKEIDASIAAKAEFEYLYDKPYADNKKVRVAGPFTVDSLSPHRVLGVDENDDLIDCIADSKLGYGAKQSFPQMILENLKTAGVQQAHKEDKIVFTALTLWPGDLVCAVGTFETSDEWLVANSQSQATNHKPLTTARKAGIFIGPEFGTVQRPDLVAAAREAGDAGFDVLIACAFNYEALTTEFNKLGRIPVLKARMNADLHMADDLKNTGKGNLFVIFGEPDVEVTCGLWLVTSNGRMVGHYESVKELSGI
ncbi:MAG: site-specific DNA-methyltransferase [Deltaproteobacteria bacterium]|nr:site-specific DNA-methyltransferase [Deltaproteobacteria bacterium]